MTSAMGDFMTSAMGDFMTSAMGDFMTSAGSDPKVTLNSTRLKLPIYVYMLLSVTESQISMRFALWPANLELEDILRQVCQMTSK